MEYKSTSGAAATFMLRNASKVPIDRINYHLKVVPVGGLISHLHQARQIVIIRMGLSELKVNYRRQGLQHPMNIPSETAIFLNEDCLSVLNSRYIFLPQQHNREALAVNETPLMQLRSLARYVALTIPED